MIAEYRCRNGHVTERIMRFEDAEGTPTVQCARCRMPAIRVVFSRTAPPKLKAGRGGFHKPSGED